MVKGVVTPTSQIDADTQIAMPTFLVFTIGHYMEAMGRFPAAAGECLELCKLALARRPTPLLVGVSVATYEAMHAVPYNDVCSSLQEKYSQALQELHV